MNLPADLQIYRIATQFQSFLGHDEASGIKVIYREEAKRDDSSCTDIQWRSNANSTKHTMFAGFANGSVASYICENKSIRPMSKLNVGSAVRWFL